MNNALQTNSAYHVLGGTFRGGAACSFSIITNTELLGRSNLQELPKTERRNNGWANSIAKYASGSPHP